MKQHLSATIAIVILGVLIYANTLNSPFAFDDFPNIVENPHVRISDFGLESIIDSGTQSPSARRPVANISFAVNYLFGKYDVRGYHIVNIVIHFLNGILVYLLANALFILTSSRSDLRAPDIVISKSARPMPEFMPLFAALVFVAHPIQTQSITYIVQRMNNMATLFYLLAVLLYIQGRFSRQLGKRWLLWAGCLGAWTLAIETKEIAATLPVAVLLYEWYFFQDLSRDWLKKNLAFLIGLILLLALIVYFYLGGLPFEGIMESYRGRDFTVGQRVLTQFRVVIMYLGLLALPLPSRLNLLHNVTPSHSFIDPITTLLSFCAIVSLIGLAVLLAKRHRIISFCILWFFLHLAIESSVVGLEMIFEHRLYLPMAGVAILLSTLLFSFQSGIKRWSPFIAILIILSLSIGTVLRNNDWRDRTTLWNDVISKNPESYRAYYNLASEQRTLGKLDAAIENYAQALRLKPDHANAHNNLGFIFASQGQTEKAVHHYYEALKIKPDHAEAHHNLGVFFEEQGKFETAMGCYAEALRINPEFAEAHNNMGALLEEQGNFKGAIFHYREALRINPNDPETRNNFGVALEGQGLIKEAIDQYLKALEIKSDYGEVYVNMGVALTRLGAFAEAVQSLETALTIDPENAGAHNNLGAVLARQGNIESAMAHYNRALQIDPEYTKAHNNIGIAMAGQGKYPDAIHHFSEALRLHPGDEETKRNLELVLEQQRTAFLPTPVSPTLQ